MSVTLAPVGDDFFTTAPIVVSGTVSLRASRERVWEVLGGDLAWSWVPEFVLGKLTWDSSDPRAVGTSRTVRLGGAMVVTETFYEWDAPNVSAFYISSAPLPLFVGFAERFELTEISGGRTSLTWTVAIHPRLPFITKLPQAVRRLISKLGAPGARSAIGGIAKVL